MCSKYVFVFIFLPMHALLHLCLILYLCINVLMHERMEGLMCAQKCKYMSMQV